MNTYPIGNVSSRTQRPSTFGNGWNPRCRAAFGILLGITLLCASSFAQQWCKTYGGAAAELGGILPAKPSTAGYFLSGSTASALNGIDTIFAQLDTSGAIQWAKEIGGLKDDDLGVQAVASGYLVTGTTKSFPSPGVTRNNLLWAQFDRTWKQVYAYVLGGAATDESGVFYGTKDGGLLFSGSRTTYGPTKGASDSDILLVKIQAAGTVQWKRQLDYGFADAAGRVVEVSGGYLIAGRVQDPILKTNGIILLKLSTAGNLVWSKLYTIDISQTFDRVGTVAGLSSQLSDGNFLLTGFMQQLNPLLGGSRTILVKIDPSGNILWQNTYGNSRLSSVTMFNIIDNGDGTLLVSGTGTDSAIVNTSILVIKISSASGTITQQRQVGLSTEHNSAVVTKSGKGLYFFGSHSAGHTDTHPKVLYGQMNGTNLTPAWAKTFGGLGSDYGVLRKTNSGFFLAGTTLSFGNNPSTGNIFGIVLDSTGNYPGCNIAPIQLLSTNPVLTATPCNLIPSTPTLNVKTPPNAVSIALPVSDITLPSADLCPPIP